MKVSRVAEPIIIGLKGDRQVGKSRIGDHLVENHGFVRIHPFNGGKVASRAYFMHMGAGELEAYRMTDGDLKDAPRDFLPVITDPEHGEVGTHYAARFFMEKFGRCMGEDMGSGWTLGAELDRALRAGDVAGLLVESIVFEAPQLRSRGGKIIEVTRNMPGVMKKPAVGIETDGVSARIVPDLRFDNSFQTIAEMRAAFDVLLRIEYGIGELDRDAEPAF